jgi:hypothetical protein
MASLAPRCSAIGLALILCASQVIFGRPAGEFPYDRQEVRLTLLLTHLADQASSSDDSAFSVRLQAEAATLLWPRDRASATAIFKRAFQAVSSIDSAGAASTRAEEGPDPIGDSRSEPVKLSPSELAQLRGELINRIARCDSELAESLANSFGWSSAGAAGLSNGYESGSESAGAKRTEVVDGTGSGPPDAVRADAERRELLTAVALQIVERAPERATELGRLSIGNPATTWTATPRSLVPQGLPQLLALLRAQNRDLADVLLAEALARLERSTVCLLSDVHALGSYLVSSIGSETGGATLRPLIARWIKLGLREVAELDQWGRPSTEESDRGMAPALDEGSAAYFVGRELNALAARYQPSRVAEIQVRVGHLVDAQTRGQVIERDVVQSPKPGEIADEAREASSESEQYSLFARAALAWLAEGAVDQALDAVDLIKDGDMRDRVLAQIVRVQVSRGWIEDGARVARRIDDPRARSTTLVRLAGAALSTRDRVRAAQLLSEAEKEALKATVPLDRAEILLTIVDRFSTFDMVAAFEVMSTAVKSINGLLEGKPPWLPASYRAKARRPARLTIDELCTLNFDGAMAMLARADFDGALLLAQQLNCKEASLVAQLAVCRGGLADIRTREAAAGRSNRFAPRTR